MTTTELIAATIAAHTPISTRYQLVAVPGTELCEDGIGVCLDCDGEGRTPNGSCTGDTAGGWADTCDTCKGTGKLTDACTNCGGAHHVQQCGELRAALGRFDADSTIAWLREELDEAHQHIGALLGMLPPTSINKDRNMAIAAARTWVRREAK